MRFCLRRKIYTGQAPQAIDLCLFYHKLSHKCTSRYVVSNQALTGHLPASIKMRLQRGFECALLPHIMQVIETTGLETRCYVPNHVSMAKELVVRPNGPGGTGPLTTSEIVLA